MSGVTLYGIPGSHPSASVAALLDAKGLEYRRVDLIPVLSRLWLRALGFPGSTIPALRLGSARIVGSRAIMRAVGVETGDAEIEAWGDDTFQPVARRIALRGLARSRAGTATVLGNSRLRPPLPRPLALAIAPAVLRLDAMLHHATDRTLRDDLDALPDLLDRIDGWIAAGRLGSASPAAADYQVAGSLRLLFAFDDLEPLFDGRASVGFARAVIPRFPGRVPAGVLPLRG